MMSNMRIITKLMLIGAILTSLVLICTLKYYLSESENSRMSKELRDVYVASALNLGEIYADGLQSEQALRNIILNPQDMKAAQNFEKAISEFDKVYNRSIDVAKGSTVTAKLDQARDLWRQGLDVKRRIIDLVKQGNSTEAIELLVKEETPKWRSFKDVILLQQDEVKKAMAERARSMDSRSKVAFHFNIAIFAATVAIIVALLLLFAFDLKRRLQEFTTLLQDMAHGEGDLTQKIDIKHGDELGALGENLNLFINKLHDLVKSVVTDTVQIVIGSTIVHDMSEDITRETSGLTAQTHAVATASEEISATSRDIACNCLQAAEGGNLAGSTATDGAMIVQDTVTGMTRIAERVRTAATTVATLGARSDQIGAIVGTIQDIADQTNLLALNAAIEAARAGEQGRGFAVVADEVRALAERTTRATSEISTMIRNIQNETRCAVESMELGVREVEQGSQDAAHSGEALQKIIDQINTVTLQINQIATAAEEQTATTTTISGNILQITEIAESTSTNISEATTASNKLLTMAENLLGLLGRFKITEDTALVLDRAKSAHMLFIGKIKAHLDGHQRVDPNALPTHLTCAFGKWYQTMGVEQCGHTSLFREIDAPHAKVHELGKKAVEAYNSGNKSRAAELCDEMTSCSKRLIGILEQLGRECKG